MSAIDISTYSGRLLETGLPGQPATLDNIVAVSKVNSGTVVIGPGKAVARVSTNENQCKAPTADTDAIIGISIRSVKAVNLADSTSTVGAAQNDVVAVMKEGFIFVTTAENTTVGAQVVSITSGNGTLGSGSPGSGRVAIPGATFESITSAGNLALVRLNG